MNLLKEIELAQRKAGVIYDTFGGRDNHKVLEAMSDEARQAWTNTNLPNELLVASDLSLVKRYAEKCGIELPEEE